MGQQQSKDELLYEAAMDGSIEAIKSLCSEGAGLEVIYRNDELLNFSNRNATKEYRKSGKETEICFRLYLDEGFKKEFVE